MFTKLIVLIKYICMPLCALSLHENVLKCERDPKG